MPTSPQPCSYSVLTTTNQATTLSTTPAPDRAAIRARHLATCEELAELGMDLARAAHREALRDMQPPPAPRALVPGLSTTHTQAPAPRENVFGQLFALISRCVRQTMLLEDRFAATDATPLSPHAAPRPHATAATPPQTHAQTPCAERLYQERIESEHFDDDSRPAEEILAGIQAELGAMPAGLAPNRQTEEKRPPRRPIPLIPPGPEPPLTAAERSALVYHQMRDHPPKQAHRTRPRKARCASGA